MAAQGSAAAGWQLSVRSDRHVDALQLRDLGAEHPAELLEPRSGRNVGYIEDELRLSRSDGLWRWSLLARQSASLATDRATLDLAARAQGRGDATRDQQWQARVRYTQFSGAGVEVGRSFVPAQGLQVVAAAQVLQLQRWRERTIDGPVQYAAATGTYSFDLRSHQGDDSKRFPFQQSYAAHGAGLLLHGSVAWEAGAWQLGAAVRDLGWLHWRGLPQQDLVLSTDTQAVDADGFVIYQPLVQGQNSQAGTTRTSSGWWSARALWALDPQSSLEGSVQTRRGFGLLPALAWRQQLGEVSLLARWRVHEQRLTLGLDWRGLSLRYGTDRLDGAAHSRELALAGTLDW